MSSLVSHLGTSFRRCPNAVRLLVVLSTLMVTVPQSQSLASSVTYYVAVMNTSTYAITKVPVGNQAPYSVAITPNGTYAYVTIRNAVSVLSTATREIVKSCG